MLKKVLFLLPFTFCFLPFSCSNPFANQSLSMTADPGVTEAWISLHVDGVRSGADYIVQRNGATVFKGRLQSPDTVVYDSLLKPATTYTYRFFARENGDDSPALQSSLTTMDTTSHNFSWQSYEFGGQHGSSYFNDVAIIDENDIWAVGEIHTDSTDRWNKDGTEWIQPYNAAHWDGQKWELIHISPEFRGYKITPEIEGVFAFDTNNIWFCAGGAPVYWDGEKYTMYHLWDMGVLGQTDGGVTKAWGTSSTNIYFVGRTGTIVHYDGKSWKKIESGTDLDLEDVTGNDLKVLTCGFWFESQLIKIENGQAGTLLHSGNYYADLPDSKYGRFSALHYKEPFWYVWSTAGLMRFLKNFKNIYLTPARDIGTENLLIVYISMNAINDIFLLDAFGVVLSFNGIRWKTDTKFLVKYGSGNLLPNRMDYEGRTVIIGSYHRSTDTAILMLGQTTK